MLWEPDAFVTPQDVHRRLDILRAQIDSTLTEILPPPEQEPADLHRAMRYAVLGGGKRLRPLLVLAAAEACGAVDFKPYLAGAAALELIHAYSLVHDDLPAMDDDDFRRGRPAVHRAFSESLAILTGDALHTLAFEVLARTASHPSAERRLAAVRELAQAAGHAGMAGGQAEDMATAGTVSPNRLLKINRRKTGALFRAAARMGGLLAGAGAGDLQALTTFGECFGEAFQIRDDLADGGPLPASVGEAKAREMMEQALTQTRAAAGRFSERGNLLHTISTHILN